MVEAKNQNPFTNEGIQNGLRLPNPLFLRAIEVRVGIAHALYQNDGEEDSVESLRIKFEKRFAEHPILAGDPFDRLLDAMELDGEIKMEEKLVDNRPILYCRLTSEKTAEIEATIRSTSITTLPDKRISHQD